MTTYDIGCPHCLELSHNNIPEENGLVQLKCSKCNKVFYIYLVNSKIIAVAKNSENLDKLLTIYNEFLELKQKSLSDYDYKDISTEL